MFFQLVVTVFFMAFIGVLLWKLGAPMALGGFLSPPLAVIITSFLFKNVE